MRTKTTIHALAAVAVIALTSAAAFALEGECAFTGSADDASLTVKLKAGSEGGKLPLRSSVQLCYLDGALRVTGAAEVFTDDSPIPVFFDETLATNKSKVKARSAVHKGDTKRVDAEAAALYRDLFGGLFAGVDDIAEQNPAPSSTYRPITEDFALERVKVASKVRSDSEGTRFTGKLSVKATGRTESGRRVKATLSLRFENAPNNT